MSDPQLEENSNLSYEDVYPPGPGATYPLLSQEAENAASPPKPQGGYRPNETQPHGAHSQGIEAPPAYQPNAYPQGEYYSGPDRFLQEQQQSNVTVVMQQPALARTYRQPSPYAGLGTGSMVCGIISTIMFFLCGCWWALPCSIIAIALGSTSQAAGESGDEKTAKTHGYTSIIFNVLGWLAAIILLAVVVGILYASPDTTTDG